MIINTIDPILDPVLENEVSKISNSFKDSATGWNETKQRIVKNIKESIKIPLTHICNKSVSNGLFLLEMKNSKRGISIQIGW